MRTAVTYLCTSDTLSLDLLTGWCEQRATSENIPVSENIVDTDELLPAAERPGWQRVMALVAGGDVVMVVTLDRTMLSICRKGWDDFAGEVAAHRAVLITHRTPVPPIPPSDGVRKLPPAPAAPPALERVDAGAQR
ncbi:hypothetical protein [Streptomyces sp. NRRL S-350]|uniref:hypothetical protein n=1 Tax=Streptomyces sp. NRRL S-350 TaxID=1463902 RepID=UPI0004C0A4F0|nr:hypothetical protein [Streptomyces sp. NRRL S-350]